MKNQLSNRFDCVFETIDGKGAIYISDFASASLKQLRRKCNIKAVISIACNGYLENRDELIDYLYIPAEDTTNYNISKHFAETFDFIDKHRRIGNVLVHCMVGKSRSATIVAAFLLKKYKYSLSDVMALLIRKRKIIKPNPGFIKQLHEYCEQLGIPKGQDWRAISLSSQKRQKSSTHSRFLVYSNTSHSTRELPAKQSKISLNASVDKAKINIINNSMNIIDEDLYQFANPQMKDILCKFNFNIDKKNTININWKNKKPTSIR